MILCIENTPTTPLTCKQNNEMQTGKHKRMPANLKTSTYENKDRTNTELMERYEEQKKKAGN